LCRSRKPFLCVCMWVCCMCAFSFSSASVCCFSSAAVCFFLCFCVFFFLCFCVLFFLCFCVFSPVTVLKLSQC
jgi:hypothetical protein